MAKEAPTPDTKRLAISQSISFGYSPELLTTNSEPPGLIGRSRAIREVCLRIGQVAPTDSTVLIQGESGTGKELVAQAIHFHSSRRAAPFIRVNCAALPASLIESEFFGHVRGAFTGAFSDRKGRFAQAHHGTILLDEIASLPLASQAKLLRVLQEKIFEPVGSSVSIKVDVRVLASDNADLAAAVARGDFREDLFYRLGVFPILIPPLRERKEDIPLLVEHFLLRHAHNGCRESAGIAPEALQALLQHHWPGNVRELENAVEYAAIMERTSERTSAIQLASLPENIKSVPPIHPHEKEFLPLRERLRRCERQAIEEALASAHGVKCKAAHLLGIDPKNFGHLLHKHGM